MKSTLTLLFILTIGAFALANTGMQHDKGSLIQIDIVMDIDSDRAFDTKAIETSENQEVVRLYRRENTLVKKALRFSTKRSRAKLA